MADDFPGVFPGALDSYTTLIDNTDNIAANHPNARGSAIAKIEAKVGVTGSAVVTAHDYLLTHLPGQATNWDAGAVEIRAETFESDVATGTAPMTIASTTKVTNLNADTVDGVSSAAIIQTTGAQSIGGVKTFTSIPLFPANTIETADIQDNAITTAKILNVNVTAGKLATDSVETLKIKDANVTVAKLASTTGSDTAVVTGTAGSAGDMLEFNADGDAVASTKNSIVQQVYTQDSAYATTSVAIPNDNIAPPQITEGAEFMTRTITPTNSSNILKIDVVVYAATGGNQARTTTLFQDTTADALATGANVLNNNSICPVSFTHYMVAGTTSETTFRVRGGSDSAIPYYFNGVGGVGKYDGTLASSITVTEIKA